MTLRIFFVGSYHFATLQVHFDHSHVGGKIQEYVYDFCNWREKNSNRLTTYFARNLFMFDFYFILKEASFSVWGILKTLVGKTSLT